jgi:homogentisate 1,2-dioxygenase
MAFYRRVGDVPRKRHTLHLAPNGERYHEELMSSDGFSSVSALLYHRHSPSALVSIEPANLAEEPGRALSPDVPLAPHHLRTGELELGADPVTGRRVLVGNDDVRMCWVRATGSSDLYRNAVGDELVYVHEGRATLETVFGALSVSEGDYVVIPASTTHRWRVDDPPLAALIFEASGHVAPPSRYLSSQGQFLEQAPYCERDLRGPDHPLLVDGDNVAVIVRHRSGVTRHVHARHPFDVTGWDGYLYPYALSIHDFEPIVGSLHQPPPVHQTFAGPSFVVCSFVPRPFDFRPDAVKVPYNHANIDCDEVLFYAGGDFMSRSGSGIGVGSISLHPAGFVHGPQPGSWERSVDKDRTEELAVMMDTFSPLYLTQIARSVSDPAYATSWAR